MPESWPPQALTSVLISQQGDQSQISISPDEKRLLYSSRQRLQHSNAQIYSYDLSNSRETRVTWSDGEAQWPMLFGERAPLTYFSNTDRIKESSFEHQIKKIDSSTLPFDLFESDIQEDSIEKTHVSLLSPLQIHRLSKSLGLLVLHPLNENRGSEILKIKRPFNSSEIVFRTSSMLTSFLPYQDGKEFFWVSVDRPPDKSTDKPSDNSSSENSLPVQYSLWRGHGNQQATLLLKSAERLGKLNWIVENEILALPMLRRNNSELPAGSSPVTIYLFFVKNSCMKNLAAQWPKEFAPTEEIHYLKNSQRFVLLVKTSEDRKQILLKDLEANDLTCESK